MANSRDNQRNELRKKRKGYTTRSSQGQKSSTGGRAKTDNEGRPTDDNLPVSRHRRTGSSEKIY